MHTNFDLKCPCPVARIFLLLSDPGHATAAGVPERLAVAPEIRQRQMIARLEPWRRPWVREFLETAYNDRKCTTQLQVLGSVGRFDRFLSSLSADDPRTWAAVTQEHVTRYLDDAHKYALEDAKPFFAWLVRRKSVEPVVIPAHGGGLQRLRPLPRRLIRELFLQWTAPDANPQWALPALLSLIHAVPPGRLRQLRLADVFNQDGQLRLRSMPELAQPVRQALANFLEWRASHYVGPSTYLLVTRANRFVDRPVGEHVLRKQAYRDHPSVGMAQAAIRELIDAGSDPLDLQAFTGLGVATIEAYLRVFQKRTAVCDPEPARTSVPG
jgi:hypothetical protein